MQENQKRDHYYGRLMIQLGWISEGLFQQAWGEVQPWISKGHNLSVMAYLQQQGHLTPSQITQFQGILRDGYFLCSSCQVAYLLSTQNQCRRCGQALMKQTLTSNSSISTGITSPSSFQSPHTQITGVHSGPASSTSISQRDKITPRPHLGFTPQKQLGKGGFGEVLQVKDPLCGRTMALKVIRGNKASNMRARQRFQREISITANLEHPNIMPVYESGFLQDGSLFYVMKELKGGTFKELLAQSKESREKVSLRELLDVFYKVCDAMEYAHSQGIIHRDLKPENIAVGDFGEVIVMDWGLAKKVGEEEGEYPLEEDSHLSGTGAEEENLTVQGSMVGTPGYMSPEQAGGEEADERSDIFSLGTILYEILSLQPAYTGSASKRTVEVLTKTPPPPHEISPHLSIPPELSAVAMKALARQRALRYQKVGELKDDLRRFQEGFGVSAQRDNLLRRGMRWVRRNKVLVGFVSAGIVLLFFAWGWRLEQQQRALVSKRLGKLRLQEKELKASVSELGGEKERLQELKVKLENKSRLLQDRARKQEERLESQLATLEKQQARIKKQAGRIRYQDRDYSFQATNIEMLRHMRQGHEAKAREIYKTLVKQGFRVALVHHNFANHCMNMKRFQEAYDIYQKSMKLQKFPEQLQAYAVLCIQMGKLAEGHQIIEEFMKLFPKHLMTPNIYHLRAQIYLRQQKWNEAVQALQLGVSSVTKLNLSPWKQAPLYSLLGDIFFRFQKKQEAIRFYQLMIHSAKNHAPYEKLTSYGQQQLKKLGQ